MVNKYVAKILVLGLMLGVLSGCATRWQKPEFSLVDVQLAGGTVFEQKLKLKLRVINPNDRDIPVENVRFSFVVAGKRFANGFSSAPVVIPRQGEAVVELEASMQILSLLSTLSTAKGDDGKLHYRLQGDVQVQEHGVVPFDHPGVLDLGLFDGHVR